MATPKNNSVIKAFDILRLLARDGRPLSPQQIARATGASLTTTHRFLLTLEEVGAVARLSGNVYHLGLLMSELAQSTSVDQILTERAKIHIETLAEELSETVTLTLFARGSPRKVAWHEPNRSLVYREHGDFGPAFHATSVGKLHLASLPAIVCEETLAAIRFERQTPRTVASVEDLRNQVREARETEVAVSFEECELGLVDVSAPLRSGAGDMIGALTVSCPVSRFDSERKTYLIDALKQACQAITKRSFVRSYTIPGKARPRGSFPHVKRVENTVFVSGTSSRRPDDTFAGVTVFPDGSFHCDTYEQTLETMHNISDILGSLTLRASDIVSLEAFLTNIDDEPAFRRALTTCLERPFPAVATIAARGLPHPHQAVMIKAIAQAANV